MERTPRHWRQSAVPLLLALTGALVLAACQGTGSTTSAPDSSSVSAPTSVRNVVVIGDSMSTGFGTSATNAWPNLIATAPTDDSMPLQIRNNAQNGSGYLNVGLTGTTFAWQVEQGVTPETDLVVFFGSVNDLHHDPTQLAAAIAEIFASTKDKAPQAALLVVGPPAYSTPPGTRYLAVGDAVKQAGRAAGAIHVDPIAEGWFVDDVDRLVGPDGLHPTVEGQHYLRDKLEPLILETLRQQPDVAGR
ncbi:SGNH/GDSL hydrolase family protein [Paeniglutamicibacter sp. MACA_103]|uniref:SGNH/GDSL hydrolase family protein n=1 Tax=Paeniglutamicibacter sp. MACA_103 TaxID=3377337 RepID=UPI003895F583